VRDPEVHRRVLLDVLTFALEGGYQVKGLARSPVLGPKGNAEFLVWMEFSQEKSSSPLHLDEIVSSVMDFER
jgi:23S rRNA (cytidine1920-2'-O)/16S rRNA (cytidine1409-2'-O)-methyltransferase